MKLELPTCDDRPVWDAWLSVYHLPAIAVADELGIFSAIKDKPGSGPELAERLHFNERAVPILLSLLTALDFLVCRGGRYHYQRMSITGRKASLTAGFYFTLVQ